MGLFTKILLLIIAQIAVIIGCLTIHLDDFEPSSMPIETVEVKQLSLLDKLKSYIKPIKHMCPNTNHRSHKGLNNRAENAHQPTRVFFHNQILFYHSSFFQVLGLNPNLNCPISLASSNDFGNKYFSISFVG